MKKINNKTLVYLLAAAVSAIVALVTVVLILRSKLGKNLICDDCYDECEDCNCSCDNCDKYCCNEVFSEDKEEPISIEE